MNKPYIGITGFKTAQEVFDVLSCFFSKTDRLLMVGGLASLKTMRGNKNKWAHRYPTMEDISVIFQDHPQVLNLIHYNTEELDTLADQLVAMTEFGGTNLHGFQLNVPWPPLSQLDIYRAMHLEKQIVLQIGGRAFDMINNSPEQLVKKVAEYEGLIDCILLDPSGGYGKQFDPESLMNYLQTLQAEDLNIGLGIAGGLSPVNLDIIRPFAIKFPDLSIDAEGRLRNTNDDLDLDLACAYFMALLPNPKFELKQGN